jgi:hypothetical protein
MLTGTLFVPALIGFTVLSPLSPLRNHVEPLPSSVHRAAVHEALALVPTEVSVSAQSGLAARLSQRREIYEFPRAGLEAEWVIVDEHGPRSSQSVDAGFHQTLDAVRQQYERVFTRDGVEVFRVRNR